MCVSQVFVSLTCASLIYNKKYLGNKLDSYSFILHKSNLTFVQPASQHTYRYKSAEAVASTDLIVKNQSPDETER